MLPNTMSSGPDFVHQNIAIFASGGGSNALKIIEYFENRSDIGVALIVTNRQGAGVLDHASTYNIPFLIIAKNQLRDENFMMGHLRSFDIDFIVLAGFLLLIPDFLVEGFAKKMVNIHPALLPDYGGPGMYGMHVHSAVKKAREKKSGITIHFVNTEYDDGAIVFQRSVQLSPDDSPEDIAKRVLKLEHRYFAPVIDHLLTGRDLEVILQSGN